VKIYAGLVICTGLLANNKILRQLRGKAVNREQIYGEMKDMLGIVPNFFQTVPDSTLEQEWLLFRRMQFEDGPVPNKYRQLIGLAVSGAIKCHYCVLFHGEAAKLFGATQAEIEDALHLAKLTTGWSTYINGLQIDYNEFKKEIQQITNYISAKKPKKEAAPAGASGR
jgi:AhpD family alkylhydroperoxidase